MAEKNPSKRSFISAVPNFLLDENGEIKWSTYLGFAVLAGAIILLLYALRTPTPIRSLAISLLTGGASLAGGVLVGFLFGIPRTLQKTASQANAGASETTGTESYAVNTNLEQISDWLTKIIVGVGLVQLRVIPGKLKALADYLATGFGAQEVPSAIVLAMICYFGIFGFLLGYLWTRIYLMGEFSRIERIARDRPEYHEGLIHAYLYQPMPTGFINAIKEANDYIKRFGDNERVWDYLACGYGQQHAYQKRAAKPNEKDLQESRENAFQAASTAMQIDADAKSFLRGLWDPNVAKPPENDLTSLYDYQEFKQLFKEEEKTRGNSNSEQ